MAEQVIQEGLLDAIPVVDLVVAALCATGPARLELKREGNSRSFAFSDRKLIRVEFSGADQSLIRMLVKRQKLTEASAEVLLAEAEATGDHIIEVVARKASIRHSELSRECGLWATLLLIQAVGWHSGSYRILLVPPPTAIADIPLEAQVAAALVKGVYKRMDLEDIEAMLGPYGESLPTLTPSPTVSTMELDLDAPQMEFLRSIDGRRDLESMLQFSPLTQADTRRMLYILHRLGLISFEDADQQASALQSSSAPRSESGAFVDAAPVDLSSIRFHRGASSSSHSATFHSDNNPHSKESIQGTHSGPVDVGVGIGHSEQTAEGASRLASEVSLAGLFDDMDLGPASTPAPGPAPSVPEADSAPVPAEAAVEQEPTDADSDPDDLPPHGAGPVITAQAWQRLSSKEKDRVRQLRNELNRIDGANYFEYFALKHESPDGSIKKAFFVAAKRYHPDALLDDSDVYRALAESLFAQFSEAWETLSDPELRDKYTRKHIFGEKDENDLALERVQQVLDAEGSFKNGLRLLNAGKLQDALRHFKAAHDNYEEEGEYLAYYAFTLFRATAASDPIRADQALEMMESAVDLSPNALKPYHLLGKAHLLRGDSKTAKRYLRKVLKLKADDAEALRDYKRAAGLTDGGGAGSATSKDKKGGFFSRFGRKKRGAPKKKSEEELYLENLDLDREL